MHSNSPNESLNLSSSSGRWPAWKRSLWRLTAPPDGLGWTSKPKETQLRFWMYFHPTQGRMWKSCSLGWCSNCTRYWILFLVLASSAGSKHSWWWFSYMYATLSFMSMESLPWYSIGLICLKYKSQTSSASSRELSRLSELHCAKCRDASRRDLYCFHMWNRVRRDCRKTHPASQQWVAFKLHLLPTTSSGCSSKLLDMRHPPLAYHPNIVDN